MTTIPQQIEQHKQKAEELRALLEVYPDLNEHSDRWSRKYLCSKQVNAKATGVFFRHSCGCCSDSPLYAMPYLETEHGSRVYSAPTEFCIGEKNGYGTGERPDDGWEKIMREAGISQTAIDLTSKYLADNPPVDFDDDDDEDY